MTPAEEVMRLINSKQAHVSEIAVIIDRAIAAEREACAKIAEVWWCTNDTTGDMCDGIAAAIRARGAK